MLKISITCQLIVIQAHHIQMFVMPLTCQSKGWFGFRQKKQQWYLAQKHVVKFRKLLVSRVKWNASTGLLDMFCVCVCMWPSIQSWPPPSRNSPASECILLYIICSSRLKPRCMALHDLYVISWYIYLVHPCMMRRSMTKRRWLMSWALLLVSVDTNMHIS